MLALSTCLSVHVAALQDIGKDMTDNSLLVNMKQELGQTCSSEMPSLHPTRYVKFNFRRLSSLILTA